MANDEMTPTAAAQWAIGQIVCMAPTYRDGSGFAGWMCRFCRGVTRDANEPVHTSECRYERARRAIEGEG